MSKFFRLILLCVVLIATTSCMEENFSLFRRQYDVKLTADLNGSQSRAIADGKSVNEVAWAVYAAGTETPLENLWGVMPINNQQCELEIRLATGKSYDIAFFAYYTDTPVTKNIVGGQINPRYYNVLFDQKKVTVKYDEQLTIANDENRDCFWYVERNLKVKGKVDKTFTLSRPLAQLNLGITEEDFQHTLKAQLNIAQTEITTESYTEFNLFDGTLSEPAPTVITFNRSETPLYGDNLLQVKGYDEPFRYLATTYVLVNEKRTNNVSVALWDIDGVQLHELNYSFVPLQRNYRTNIIGNLLTSPNHFKIVIEEEFDGDHIE